MSEDEKAALSGGQEDPCENLPEFKTLSPLGVLDEFMSVYEDRIRFIDREIGENSPEVKLPIYKKWVEDLSVQNRELVKAVEEVETVVSDRLNLLEERLQQEKYKLHDRRVFRLESDVQNLLIFLRRAIRDNNWSTDGLQFHEIDLEKSLADFRDEKDTEESKITVELTPESSRIITGGLEDISKEFMNIRDDIRNSTVIQSHEEQYKSFEENAILREKLESTQRELNLLQLKNKELEKASSDTQVLVEEIATKHDTIQRMRTDCGRLEEQIRQAGMQIHFKDDVIRELRREISALKKTNTQTDGESTDSSAVELSKDIPSTKTEMEKDDKKSTQTISEELNQLKMELGLMIPESEEANEPEIEILSAIKHDFFNLRKTNSLLRVENAEMHGQVAQMREQLQNFTSQSDRLSQQGRQLDEMQQVISKIRNSIKSFGGNPEDAEARSDSDLLANFSDVLQELKRENATKDDEIGKQRREIESFTKNQESMQTVIEDLKGAVEMHKDTVSELKSANEELQRRLKDAESHRPNEIFAKLLADKNRLEVENGRFRLAVTSTLQSFPRGGAVGVVRHQRKKWKHQSDAEIGVEVLGEILRDVFSENMRLDRQVTQLYDENLNYRAELHEALVGLAELQQKSRRGSSRASGSSSTVSGRSAPRNALGVSERGKSGEMEPDGGQRMLEQNKYTQIIDDLSNELQSLTEQLLQQPQQQDLIADSLQLKNLMDDLELQNDNLQQTIESYIEQVSQAETKINKLEFENSTLESELKNSAYELERKEAKIEELLRENKTMQSQLDIQRRFCTCKTSSMAVDNGNGKRGSDNTDKDTQCIQELQKLLNQKSTEASKATVALRWKSLEWGRMQQIAMEDKKKLTEQTKELISNVGELKQKISFLEVSLEKRDKDLERANQKLQIASQRETELMDELAVKTDQLTFFEKGESKYRDAIEDLTQEIQAVRSNRIRRESVMIQELNAANTSLRGGSAELEKQNTSLMKENSILKSDMNSLRDEVATLEGRSRALSELLKANQGEMDLLKQEVNRLIALDTEVVGIREDKAIFEKHNQDLLKRYQTLQKDYEELQNEYKLLLEIKSQTEIILENMKMWESEHEEREKIIQKKISKQTEHINTLLDDRKMLITKINTMHQDMVVLSSERQKYEEKFKEMLNGPSIYLPNSQDNMSLPTKLMRYNSDPQLNDPQNVWRKVRHTAKRLFRTRRLWEEHLQDALH